MHTLKSLAEFLGELDNRSDDEKSQLHAQLRNLHAKLLIRAERPPGAGRTAAVQISAAESARARVLTTLIEVEFEAPRLAEINAALDAPISYLGQPPPSAIEQSGYITSNGGLSDALRGIAAGEKWQLSIELFRTSEGVREIETRFVWPGLDAAEPDELVHLMQSRKLRCTITVPLNDLLRPFAG